jgi:integrase
MNQPTGPAAAPYGGVPWPDPSTVVLRGRRLHPLADTTTLSRFRDDVWVTRAADVDNAVLAPALSFTPYPPALRGTAKAFALAVLGHERPASLMQGSPGEQASLASLGGWLCELRVFAAWLDARGIQRVCDVTADDLDLFRAHVISLSVSKARQADYLHVVRVLWAYREHLPPECRLPAPQPWGSATARQLAGHTGHSRYNKTPRIHPDTMKALLAWALRVLEDFGPDIRDAFLEDRQLKNGTHPTARFYREHYFARPVMKRVQHYLPQLRDAGQPLPGQRNDDGSVTLACGHLARVLALEGANPAYRFAGKIIAAAAEHGVPLGQDAPLGQVTGRLNGLPWRREPIGLTEVDQLVRMLRTAAFITICYLSGMRGGEVLGLRRGCLREDEHGQFSLAGLSSKGLQHRAREDGERTWAVVSVVATAVTMLESLTDSPWLFPPSTKRASSEPIHAERHLKDRIVNADILAFIAWVNATFTRPDGRPPIPPDPAKPVHASRFRRTLAYFVVRRPGGLIAAALQYGHVSTKVTLGYSGDADTGWMDDLVIERLEMVIDQAADDLDHLSAGEHVSGPSAEEYRRRLDRSLPFAGRVTDKVRNAERLLASADPDIHHGKGMTCVYRAETALCRLAREEAGLDGEGPDEADCRSACTNLAYTDRDIGALLQRLSLLEQGAADPLAPRPLRDRGSAQASRLRAIIDRHQATRPAADALAGAT